MPPTAEVKTDPTFYGMQQQAITDYQNSLQRQLQEDTAAIVARYGSRAAMGSSPGVAAAMGVG